MIDPNDDDLDGDDPVHWGGAELGKPQPAPGTPPPARRDRHERGVSRRDLAKRVERAKESLPRPPWVEPKA